MEERTSIWRKPGLALLAASVLVTPILVGCGGPSERSGANMPPVDDSRAGMSTAEQPTKRGLSTGQKVALLAGAAALYYMYKKNKEKRAAGNTSEPQYYLSRNGRVYYRDASGRAHWVSPPQGGIQVPESEAMQYRDFQGYNNRTDGRDLVGMGME